MYNSLRLNPYLLNTCRICLDKLSEPIDLFSENVESRSILKKIYECFQITLQSENYLPSVICQKCNKELNVADSFRIKCVTVNERLKDFCEKLLETSPQRDETSKEPDDSEPSITPAEDNQSTFDIEANYEPYDTEKATFKGSNFKCEKCNKILKSLKSLLRHGVSMHDKQRHIGKVSGFGAVRRYHCTNCSYSTPHSQTLVNHMRRHNGERPFGCECGKNFTQASSLAAHKKTHSTISYFTCSQCGKQFKHAFSLKTHLRVHSKGNFICNICTKILKSKETLHAHMKRHYKIYDYNCEDCGDTFITSAELHNHQVKHSTKKTIECHICDFSTNTKKNLVMHLKRHVGNKAFKCGFCVKSFYTQGDLRRHMRVHTREKPFSCQTCAQRFTYSTSLNKHMQTVHSIQYKWGDVKWKEARMKKLPTK